MPSRKEAVEKKCPWPQCQKECIEPRHAALERANVALAHFVHGEPVTSADIQSLSIALLELGKYLGPVEPRDELLREVISTFYMNDNDQPTWADQGLGKRIADHLGLKKEG